MRFDYEKRLALLYFAREYQMSLASAFLDLVVWSKYGTGRYSSARVVLSPFLFRYLLKRDLVRLGVGAAAFYTSHFDVDLSLRGFCYRVEFPSGQMSLF